MPEEKELIKEHFSRIEEIIVKIREIFIKAEECGFDQQNYQSIKFCQRITKRLSVLSQTLYTNENAPSSNSRCNLSKEQVLLMLVKLEYVKFSGVRPSKFELKNFLAQFQNCVMHLESNKVKLTLLKINLSDYVLQLISHLTLENCNCCVAIDLLKREFLNENLIINAIFNQILSYKPKYDPEYSSIRQFLTEI